jgi:hypothetical protein
MKIIKELAHKIKEELNDAENYAKASLEERATNPSLAAVYFRLANDEIGHAEMLHEQAVVMIRKHSEEKEIPPVMRELWAWQHEEIVEEEKEVRMLLEMAKR